MKFADLAKKFPKIFFDHKGPLDFHWRYPGGEVCLILSPSRKEDFSYQSTFTLVSENVRKYMDNAGNRANVGANVGISGEIVDLITQLVFLHHFPLFIVIHSRMKICCLGSNLL